MVWAGQKPTQIQIQTQIQIEIEWVHTTLDLSINSMLLLMYDFATCNSSV